MTGYDTAKQLREKADRIENPIVFELPDFEPWNSGDLAFQIASDGTAVSLPHQCEDWLIAEGPPAYVAEHLADFIRRAQAALDQITAMTEDT